MGVYFLYMFEMNYDTIIRYCSYSHGLYLYNISLMVLNRQNLICLARSSGKNALCNFRRSCSYLNLNWISPSINMRLMYYNFTSFNIHQNWSLFLIIFHLLFRNKISYKVLGCCSLPLIGTNILLKHWFRNRYLGFRCVFINNMSHLPLFGEIENNHLKISSIHLLNFYMSDMS